MGKYIIGIDQSTQAVSYTPMRFWEAVCRGGYPGHGETYMNEDDILWWSHGGVLHGESHKRFQFLYDIMCQTPGVGLRPYEKCGWDEVCAVPEESTQQIKQVLSLIHIYRPGLAESAGGFLIFHKPSAHCQ